MDQNYNPIRSVDGAAIRCPSSCKYKLEDVSAADAGRTEDTVMDKMRVGQLVGLELEWQNITPVDASALLKAFQPEYITVEYFDLKENQYITSVFYVGNRAAPIYNSRLGIVSSLEFNLIERSGLKDDL